MKKLEQQYKRKKDWLIVIGILLMYAVYFVMNHLPIERHVVYISFDDKIPFWEIFVIPYVFWYLFVTVPLIYFFNKSREDFLYLGTFLLIGVAICTLIFIIYPSQVELRPEVFSRENPFTWLVGTIYDSDGPYNVFPSVHCFESTAICIGIWKSKSLGKRRWAKIWAVVIATSICLSTVLIKQHSILDFLAGIVLAGLLALIIYKFNWPFGKRFEEGEEIENIS